MSVHYITIVFIIPTSSQFFNTLKHINNFICFNVLKNCALVGIIKTKQGTSAQQYNVIIT